MTILDHFDIPGLDWCSSADQLASMKQTLKTEVMCIQQPTEPQVSQEDLEPPGGDPRWCPLWGIAGFPQQVHQRTVRYQITLVSNGLQKTLMHYLIGSNNS